jgi:aminoglycoside phosphotransferase family enzyme
MCVKLIETHISFVFLVGTELVFKIKKKCNLGFLDFTDLKHRKKFCKRELELNSRFSPMIYKRVLAIAGNCDEPRFVDLESGDDSVFEYAVEMNQFDTEMQLDKLIQRGELTFETIEDLATLIARAHRNAPRSLTSDDSFCKHFYVHFIFY